MALKRFEPSMLTRSVHQGFTATGKIYGKGNVLAAKVHPMKAHVTLDSNRLKGFDFGSIGSALPLLLSNVFQPALDGKDCKTCAYWSFCDCVYAHVIVYTHESRHGGKEIC